MDLGQNDYVSPKLAFISSLIHELSENNDKNIQSDLIIMEFSKAFDNCKVPHKNDYTI